MTNNNIITRMAPSPTGNLHLGTAYATLWPYLLAKHQQGQFILRIEDTDADRSTKEYADNILAGLKWLGLTWDQGPFYQMQRLELYRQKIDQLLAEAKAYRCFCTKEELDAEHQAQVESKQPQIYSGRCRHLSEADITDKLNKNIPYVVRFKMPEDRGMIEFIDMIHGKIAFDSSLLGDFVISRQTGLPLYNFVVVVDDIDMQITHILRGDDHISNTPKQIVIYEAFNANIPQIGHYPMILNQDRMGKLSKRTGSTPVEFYRHEGYLPEALINYLALLGWSSSDDREIYSLVELAEKFEIKDMTASAAAWNQQKLDWINGEYIRSLSDQELTRRLIEFLPDHPAADKISQLVPLIKERIKKLSDFVPMTNFLFEGTEFDLKVFDQIKVPDRLAVIDKIISRLEAMPRPWTIESFEQTFQQLAQELTISNRDMFQLIRVAFSGQLVTPPLFEIMQYVGEDDSLNRIKAARLFLAQ